MEEALLARLLAAPAVTALCGTRIGWMTRAQGGVLPAVVLTLVSGAEGVHLRGGDGLLQARVQADCWGATYPAAKALSRAVVAALHATAGDGFRGIMHETTRDLREGGTNEADRPYRVSLDFIVNWRAT